MDKLKYIKIEDEDGSLSNNIPIGVDAENVDISSNNFKNLLDYINENDNQIDNLKNSNISLSNQIKSLSSGSPKGSYATVDELIRVNPETGVYIITENGHIYSWTKDAESAIDLGVYQSAGISDNSIEYRHLADEVKDALVFKNSNFYGEYNKIFEESTNALGTNITTGYYNITRNKPIEIDCKITKIYIGVLNNGQKGKLKLSRLNFSNNIITKISDYPFEYDIIYGNNIIELQVPFKVYKGEYIGFTVTPTTESPYPVGHCNLKAINNSSYNYGIIANRYSDNRVVIIDKFTPCFDFEITSMNYNNIENKNWLENKNWIAYGDSITAGYNLPNHNDHEANDNNNLVNTYVKIVAENNNMIFHNYGTSGRGYSNGTNENYKAYKIIENNHLDNIDIVTVAFGTNDYGTLNEDNKVEFGDVTDLSSGSTFCSYVKKAFDALNTYYPNAVIIIMLPIPRKYLDSNNVMGKNLIDYCEAIKTIACYYGFYVMDCISLARSNVKSAEWQNSYMLDNVHMTESYHQKYYAPMVEEQLKLAHIN